MCYEARNVWGTGSEVCAGRGNKVRQDAGGQGAEQGPCAEREAGKSE